MKMKQIKTDFVADARLHRVQLGHSVRQQISCGLGENKKLVSSAIQCKLMFLTTSQYINSDSVSC